MTTNGLKSLAIILLVITLAALGWMFRWQAIEVHTMGDHSPSAFLVNRWTGEMRYLQDVKWVAVQEIKR